MSVTSAAGKLALAVTAAGQDPRDFGGIDLTQAISATYAITSGQFGAGTSPTGTVYIDDLNMVQGDIPGGCNAADVAEPFCTLNFFDVSTFIGLFNANDPAADLAAPFGTFNFFDISNFITIYNQGCAAP